MNSNGKRYGLLLPNKSASASNDAFKKPLIFDDDSDSMEEKEPTITDWIKSSLEKGTKRRQTKLDIQKVLNDDPTAYQYDELYDNIQEKKTAALQAKKQVERKPRYIQNLLAQASKRKLDNERKMERQIQKERDEEGDEFADKESFITTSYKKKLEELKKLDDEERRLDMLEEIGDVTKQRDMTGFYRHLYRTVTNEDSSNQIIESKPKPTPVVEPTKMKRTKDCEESGLVRHYRKRKLSHSSSNSDNDNKNNCKISGVASYRKNEDKSKNQDSDTSMSSSSESEQSKNGSDTEYKCKKSEVITAAKNKVEKIVLKTAVIDGKEVDIVNNSDSNTTIVEDIKPPIKSKKPKINIWEKRTTGNIFEDALKRYFERKASRSI